MQNFLKKVLDSSNDVRPPLKYKQKRVDICSFQQQGESFENAPKKVYRIWDKFYDIIEALGKIKKITFNRIIHKDK